jgi:hypothetical protein
VSDAPGHMQTGFVALGPLSDNIAAPLPAAGCIHAPSVFVGGYTTTSVPATAAQLDAVLAQLALIEDQLAKIERHLSGERKREFADEFVKLAALMQD